MLSLATNVATVSELTRRIRQTLEAEIDDCWVVGEISNFRAPASGHFYFSLKDQHSQIAAVMFRAANQLLAFQPRDGMEVVVRGRVGMYAARGSLQLYIERLEPRGRGAVQLALEQLKERLASEGLFAPERKRVLPTFPRAVGIATGVTGAAVHDLLRVLHDRLPAQRVVLRPVRVQGTSAAGDIVGAIDDLNSVAAVDVIIVGRGGGSLEDLAAFNDERVARAIAGSRVPVVSAVGHEIDVTLADLVADQRAPTPTAAAAMVVPDGGQLSAEVSRRTGALVAAVWRCLNQGRERVGGMRRRVRDPSQVLRSWRMRVDELSERSQRGLTATLRFARERVRGEAERLQALSPLAVLQRGYSITRRVDDGSVVRDGARAPAGIEVELTFAHGWARARISESRS